MVQNKKASATAEAQFVKAHFVDFQVKSGLYRTADSALA